MLTSSRLMDRVAPGQWPRCVAMCVVITVITLTGCSGTRSAAPVEPERARQALETTLDGWKRGAAPSALNENTPPITAQDLDWLAGAKLVDFKVNGPGKSLEANLYVPVTLTLKPAKGKEVKKNVTYVVGTSPYLTVFRALP